MKDLENNVVFMIFHVGLTGPLRGPEAGLEPEHSVVAAEGLHWDF